MVLKIAVAVVLFLSTIASGVWLSHAGKPLNPLLLTLHKLIALATVVVSILAVVFWRKTAELGILTLLLLILTGLLLALLFASGAWLSTGKPLPGIFLSVHQIATLAAVIAAAVLLWGPK
jgi:hypothetical protein